MSARTKLNVAAFNGAIVVAGVVGALAQSWWVFGLLTTGLLLLAIHAGETRLRGRDR